MATTGERKLGEKYLFYVKGQNISSSRDISDATIAEAVAYFTKAYGVRITTIEDLDAIHDSAAAYYKRPQKDDIPQAAVDRATIIATMYTPYNNQPGSWTEDKFLKIPYQTLPPNTVYGQPPPIVTPAANPVAGDINPAIPAGDIHSEPPVSSATATSTAGSSDSLTANPTTPPPGTEPWYKKYKVPLLIGGGVLAAAIIYRLVKHKKSA